MEIKIFDVSHGFCAYLVADNGNVMLFDCGHNEKTDFKPSSYLPTNGFTGIEHLIIQNFDQDHVSDLHNLLEKLPVELFFRNRSITPKSLMTLKDNNGSVTDAMRAAINLHSEYVHAPKSEPSFPGIEFECYSNSYPQFTDTNNLSLVSFIHYEGMGIIFPGDIEKSGWEELLKYESFCNQLKRVNIFIASHHGRENGYYKEVFDYCTPEIIIISDQKIVYDSQKNKYSQHATGIPWNGGPEKRYVLTTRSDGDITITKNSNSGFHISI
jgi:beta-lactamase superfamily II metal-dependent hydrolase